MAAWSVAAVFWAASSGVAVYRPVRVAPVFAADSRDMKKSLAWQLGGLRRSMAYEADIPNFLEPWHGIGTMAAAFGFGYLWEKGQAPAVDGKFVSAAELAAAPVGSSSGPGLQQRSRPPLT